jgi:hypothetical protein
MMAAVAGLCCVPILIWNAQHDWVSVRHLVGLSGMQVHAEEPPVYCYGPLVYVGQQAALLLGFWFVAWAWAMFAHRPWREPNAGLGYLWWMSAPMFLVFLAFSPRTGGGEVNWPVTAYLSGMVLAAGWIGTQLRSASPRRRRLATAALASACVLGLMVTLFVHESQKLYPAMARLVGAPRGPHDFPLRKLDPTCRLRGYQGTLAAEVDRVREWLRAVEGREPTLAGVSWILPGELGVYCAGHPQAYSVGAVVGERHSQYDLWPNPVRDGEQFRGRTFVVVGGMTEELKAGFDWVGPTWFVSHKVHGQPVTGWFLTICRGYRGHFPTPGAGRNF